jgi:hypothetical protein
MFRVRPKRGFLVDALYRTVETHKIKDNSTLITTFKNINPLKEKKNMIE